MTIDDYLVAHGGTAKRFPGIAATQEQFEPAYLCALFAAPAAASGCEGHLTRLDGETAVAGHNFLLDLAYPLIDPRISYRRT